jgi:hypothetical protein
MSVPATSTSEIALWDRKNVTSRALRPAGEYQDPAIDQPRQAAPLLAWCGRRISTSS